MSERGKPRFLNARFGSLLGAVRLGSIPLVNNSQARKFSLLSGKFSHAAELLGFSPPSKFLFLFLYIVIYITYISSTDLRLVTIYIYIYIYIYI
uniref:Uncharacterized protein n=1 Tax=Arundo donax TaxID=35708 RepID=A0A0A9B214_ARUDO